MTIDFTFPPELEDVRLRLRRFLESEVKPVETGALWQTENRRKLVETIDLPV